MEIDGIILMAKYPPIISRTTALNFRTSIEFSMLVATNDIGTERYRTLAMFCTLISFVPTAGQLIFQVALIDAILEPRVEPQLGLNCSSAPILR